MDSKAATDKARANLAAKHEEVQGMKDKLAAVQSQNAEHHKTIGDLKSKLAAAKANFKTLKSTY